MVARTVHNEQALEMCIDPRRLVADLAPSMWKWPGIESEMPMQTEMRRETP